MTGKGRNVRKSQRSRTRCASKTTAADVNQAEKDPVDALMLFHVFSNVHAVKRAREPESQAVLDHSALEALMRNRLSAQR